MSIFRVRPIRAVAALCVITYVTNAAGYQAGVSKVADDTGQANASIWYPTYSREVRWKAGDYEIAATRDAPVAAGRFSVVLLSHGRQGSSLSHRDLSARLAREGFIVVTPAHSDITGQATPFNRRAVQVVSALRAVANNDRFSSHVDLARIGMIGYSMGGNTALIVAKAKPNYALASAYCEGKGQSDIGSCGSIYEAWAGKPEREATQKLSYAPKLKALVLLDPFTTMFDAAGLVSVRVPVLLYRPENDSYMRSAANATALAKNLPLQPHVAVLPGHHFSFIDPCPEKVALVETLVCTDAPNINRKVIHKELETKVVSFLRANLR